MSIVAEFRDFVFAQDPKREIDHGFESCNNEAWSTCAVGEFFKATRGAVPAWGTGELLQLVGRDAYDGELGAEYPSAHHALNHFGPETYGELQELLTV
jgi:hypothetical protein